MQTEKRGFQWWSGDVNWQDYGGTWIRQVGERRFHFLSVTNMDEACGRDNEGSPKYSIELSEVDLDVISVEDQASAWESIGGDCQIRGEITIAERVRITAGCCFEYGAKAPLHEEPTNNVNAGFRLCRAESYHLTSDAAAYAERMDRPVNKLGSSAREYMTGDITSAIVRGANAGNPQAQLMARIYVNCEGQTLGGKIPDSELAAMKTAIKGEV